MLRPAAAMLRADVAASARDVEPAICRSRRRSGGAARRSSRLGEVMLVDAVVAGTAVAATQLAIAMTALTRCVVALELIFVAALAARDGHAQEA